VHSHSDYVHPPHADYRPYTSVQDGIILLVTPHYPTACQLHAGGAVPSPTGHCEHVEPDEEGVPGYCCYCGAEGDWPVRQGT
jgi:hypothetical protein